MGESITEATVGEILKTSGTVVSMDEEVLELETDKVNQVLYAPQGGTLTLSVNVDDVVTIDQVIGYVEANGAQAASGAAPAATPQGAQPQPTPQPSSAPSQGGGVSSVTKDSFIASLQPPPTQPQPAPVAPSAPPPQAAAPSPAPQGAMGMEERESPKRMSKIRKVIANRLVEAQQTTAMLTTFNEVDMSAVMELRNKHKEGFLKKHGTKLGFMSFFTKAAVSALQAFPDVNSYIRGEEIVERHYYDIGIAVGTPRGLMVPVIRNCDQLDFAQIEKGITSFATKAREGGISVDDLQGGSFTITNGGIYGSMLSTPILNTPQTGILGMHNIVKRAVVIEDEIVIRPMMYLAMSYDHRLIDGAQAVSFLVHIKNCLEDPSRLILNM